MSETNGPNSTRAQLIIDAELEQLAEKARLLRQERNTHSPISSLPVELLLHIFALCIYESTVDSSGTIPHTLTDATFPYYIIRPLTHISSICTNWRTSAANHPRLWTWISLSHPKWSRECLLRSKHVPVSVLARPGSVYNNGAERKELFNQILNGPNQIRQLIIYSTPDFMEQLPISLQAHSASLKILDITYLGASGGQSIGVLDIQFISRLSNLHYLAISGCQLQWTVPITPSQATSVTVLRLRAANRLITEEFFAALRLTPALQVLELKELPGSSHVPVPSKDPTIFLNHLNSLQISTSIQICVSLLSRLRYPPAARISIAVSGGTNGQLSALQEALGRDLLKLCGFIDAPSVLHLRVVVSAYTQENMIIARRDHVTASIDSITFPEEELDDGGPNATIKFSRFSSQSSLMSAVIPHISVPRLKQLNWDVSFERVGSEVLAKFVSSTPHLKELALLGGSRIHDYRLLFCQVMDIDTTQPSCQQHIPPHARGHRMVQPTRLKNIPSLTHLQISEVNFGNEGDDDDEEIIALQYILKFRKQNRAKLHHLYLKNCYCVDNSFVAKLRKMKLAKNILWDGVVQGFTDSEEEEGDYYDYDSDYINSEYYVGY